MERREAEQKIAEAIEALYEEELAILRLDISERTICGQLRGILEQYFEDHEVHAEYNRHGVDPKEVELPNGDGVLTKTRVYPDLIIHQPGHDDDNLIVIEVKKSTNPESDERDLMKLSRMKQQLGYEHAVFLRLPTGAGAEVGNVRVVWI